MKLLEKTRKINHLLQKGEVVQFDEIAELAARPD
jgi:GTP-sensing pleiotropic transcriptional regulator CodY